MLPPPRSAAGKSGQGWKDDLGLHIQRTIRRGAACRPVCSVPASQRPHSGSANFEDKKPGRERSMPASKIEQPCRHRRLPVRHTSPARSEERREGNECQNESIRVVAGSFKKKKEEH